MICCSSGPSLLAGEDDGDSEGLGTVMTSAVKSLFGGSKKEVSKIPRPIRLDPPAPVVEKKSGAPSVSSEEKAVDPEAQKRLEQEKKRAEKEIKKQEKENRKKEKAERKKAEKERKKLEKERKKQEKEREKQEKEIKEKEAAEKKIAEVEQKEKAEREAVAVKASERQKTAETEKNNKETDSAEQDEGEEDPETEAVQKPAPAKMSFQTNDSAAKDPVLVIEKTDARKVNPIRVNGNGDESGEEPGTSRSIERERVREKVRSLRREKKEKFKELTDGFIKKIISEEEVLSKEQFLEPGNRSLEECVKRAVDVNMQAKMTKEKTKLSKQRIVKSLRDLFSSAVFDMERREGSLSGSAFRGESFHVLFKQPVFHGGVLWNTFQKEQSILHSVEAEYSKNVDEIIQKVSEAYFDTLRAKAVLEDKQEHLKLANEIFEMNRKKWADGLISEIEYLNVESKQSQIAHDVEKAKEDYELVLMELQKHLNLDLTERVELTPFYDYELVMDAPRNRTEEERTSQAEKAVGEFEFDKPVEHYLQIAYDNRPDLKQEVNRLRANIMAKRVASGKLLPQTDMVLKFGELGEVYTDTPRDQKAPYHNPEWQAMVEFSWNLGGNTMKYTFDRDERAPSISQYQGGSGTDTHKQSFSVALLDNLEDLYRVKEAEIEIMDQFVKLEETEREMLREVKEAYFNFRRAEIQLKSEMKQIVYREKLAKLSKHKLDIREIEASEYLQSEFELIDEKEKFHKAMADYYVARVGLNRAVGVRGLMPIEQWKDEKNGKQ